MKNEKNLAINCLLIADINILAANILSDLDNGSKSAMLRIKASAKEIQSKCHTSRDTLREIAGLRPWQ
jgi:hypothetical protein